MDKEPYEHSTKCLSSSLTALLTISCDPDGLDFPGGIALLFRCCCCLDEEKEEMDNGSQRIFEMH